MILCDDPTVINADPKKYVSLVQEAIHERRAIPQPETVSQLQALAEFYPDIARPLLPPPGELSRLGMSRFTCREIPPLSLEWRERFVATLGIDPEFRATIAGMLAGGDE